jgi:hypothetical protein
MALNYILHPCHYCFCTPDRTSKQPCRVIDMFLHILYEPLFYHSSYDTHAALLTRSRQQCSCTPLHVMDHGYYIGSYEEGDYACDVVRRLLGGPNGRASMVEEQVQTAQSCTVGHPSCTSPVFSVFYQAERFTFNTSRLASAVSSSSSIPSVGPSIGATNNVKLQPQQLQLRKRRRSTESMGG